MVNGWVALEPVVDTAATLTAPSAAAPVLVMTAVIVVGLTTETPLTETPVADGVMTTLSPVTKFAPVRVTLTAEP
jgi:hypothetical protein